MQQYRNNVQDQFGNVIANVTVTVNVRPGGGLATIFSDDGVTPKSNPFTNDSDSEFNFYAENGRYDIELTGPLTESIPDIRLLDLVGAGASSFRVFTDIVTATPPTTEAVTGNFEIWDFDNDDQLASLGYNGSNLLELKNVMHGGNIRLSGEDAAGVEKTLLIGDPDGTVELHNPNDGVKRMSMLTNGRVEIFSNGNTDVEDRYISLAYADGTDVARIGHIGNPNLYFRNRIHGGSTIIQAEDTGGTVINFLNGDPDAETFVRAVTTLRLQVASGEDAIVCLANGPVELYWDEQIALRTFSQGIEVRSATDTDTEDREVVYTHQDGLHRAVTGHFGSDVFSIKNQIHGGNVSLNAEDAGGTPHDLLVGDPDGATALYYDGLEYFRTQNRLVADVTSGAEVQDGNGVWQDVGFNVLGQILTDANYTIDRTECGYDIYKQASGAVTYTIPAAAATAQTDIPFGAVYEITNEDTEDLTIDGTETGITLRWCPTGGTGDRTLAQWGIARLKKRNDSSWFITGVGIT